MVWIVDVSSRFDDRIIKDLDKEEHMYSWSRASRMFDFLPLPQESDRVSVVLYWKDYEVDTVDYKQRPLTYKRIGYLNHVVWTNEVRRFECGWDDEDEHCMVRPDFRVFAISNRQSLENPDKLDISAFFDKKSINKKKFQKIANAFFEEREERSRQFINW